MTLNPSGHQTDPKRYGFAVSAYVMMLLGMAAHGAFNHLGGGPAWNWAAFASAVVISPMIYASFLAVVRSRIDAITGGLIAFQNGFFWKDIFQSAGPLVGFGSP